MRPAARATAESLGSCAFLLRACYAAAGENGIFESTLMESKKIQQELADLTTALEAARLRAGRSLLLFEEGRTAQAEEELGRTLSKARALEEEIVLLARALLGEPWLRERTPGDRSGRPAPEDTEAAGVAPGKARRRERRGS